MLTGGGGDSNAALHCAGRRRTWAQFGDRVARLAAALKTLGVKEEKRFAVGMLSFNSDRYLEYFHAVVWAGGIFVPINTRLAPPEIAYWLNNSGCAVLFVEDSFLSVVADIRNDLPSLTSLIYCGDGADANGLLHYEALIEQHSPVEDAGAATTTSPASTTPVARPESRRA